jgi:hypothetical protein
MSFTSPLAPSRATIVKHREPKPYRFQPYPSVRYHPDGSTRTVQNLEEDQALGQEWTDKPFPVAPKPPAAPELSSAEMKAEIARLTAANEQLVKDHADVVAYCAERMSEIAELRAAAAKPKPAKTEKPKPE